MELLQLVPNTAETVTTNLDTKKAVDCYRKGTAATQIKKIQISRYHKLSPM